MKFEELAVDIDGAVATIVLDRPNKLNAITLDMLTEIVEATHHIASSDVRAVVVSGNGTSFSAGMDLGTFSSGALSKSDPERRYEAANLGGEAATSLETLPQMTIAALHGHVVGGGVVLAAACDLRIAERGTVFSIPEVDIGIPLAWGGVERLVREIGPARTKELIMTCRPFSAEEAERAGFINAIVESGEAVSAAMDLATIVAQKSRFAVTTTKRHVAEILAGDASRDDALGLLAAIDDPSWPSVRDTYLRRRQ